MVRFPRFPRRATVLTLLMVLFVGTLSAQTFASLRLVERPAPEGFENARRYEIAYLDKDGNELGEKDFPATAKMTDMEFIQAALVREIRTKEYEAQGFKVDIHQVLPTTIEEILSLVAEDFPSGSSHWDPANRQRLATYLRNDPQALVLYKMNVWAETVDGVSEETVPLILRLKQCPGQRDLLTFFFVTTLKYQE